MLTDKTAFIGVEKATIGKNKVNFVIGAGEDEELKSKAGYQG